MIVMFGCVFFKAMCLIYCRINLEGNNCPKAIEECQDEEEEELTPEEIGDLSINFILFILFCSFMFIMKRQFLFANF